MCNCLQPAIIFTLCCSLLLVFIPYFGGGCDKAMMDGPGQPRAAYTNCNKKLHMCKVGLWELPQVKGYILPYIPCLVLIRIQSNERTVETVSHCIAL